MPPDNAASVPIGADVAFPEDGPSTTPGIIRTSLSTFALTTRGVYRVTFQVPVNEPGQLELTVNDLPVPYTVTGRATGTSPIALTTLIDVTTNSVISVRNPATSLNPLTITAFAGGYTPNSASLLIELVKAG
jgi:hypothetical protein